MQRSTAGCPIPEAAALRLALQRPARESGGRGADAAGDVLIQGVALPEPRRGGLLAVPATGAYTFGMGSNYNGVPRPAVVLVEGETVRLIRRRETIEDLLGYEHVP